MANPQPAPDRPRHDVADPWGGLFGVHQQAPIRVRVMVSPTAWPLIAGRTWGSRQRVEEAVLDGVYAGWRRFAFTTTNQQACQRWLLGLGREVLPLAPPDLVQWLKRESGVVALQLQEVDEQDVF